MPRGRGAKAGFAAVAWQFLLSSRERPAPRGRSFHPEAEFASFEAATAFLRLAELVWR